MSSEGFNWEVGLDASLKRIFNSTMVSDCPTALIGKESGINKNAFLLIPLLEFRRNGQN